MTEQTMRIDLEEFDRWAAGRFETLAKAVREAADKVEGGDPELEADHADYVASARALREEPPHRGQWIAIKRTLSHGDVSDAKSAAYRRDDAGRSYHDDNAYRTALMASALTAWSLADEDGTPWPTGVAGVRRLDEVLADWLYDRIEEQRASYLRTREQMARLKSGGAGRESAA